MIEPGRADRRAHAIHAIAEVGGFTILGVLLGAVAAVLMATGVVIATAYNAGIYEPAQIMALLSEVEKRNSLVVIVPGILGTSMALSALAFFQASRRSRAAEVRLRFAPTGMSDVILAVAGMLGLTVCLSEVITLLDMDNHGTLALLHDTFTSLPLSRRMMLLPVTALAAGLAEEIFFRGYALSALERGAGRRAAIVVSALLFGLIHFDPVHSAAAFLMGLFLAYCVTTLGSVWTTIAAHVVNNAVATLFPDLSPDSARARLVLGLTGLGIFLLVLSRLARRASNKAAGQGV